MPGFDLVFIDFFSFLVALVPSIEVSIFTEPGDITSEFCICEVVVLRTCVEEVDRETELMFAVSSWCAESVTTSSEVPEPLLIGGTSVATYYYD